ncbi:MAG: hypothetical protein A2854_03880 [Parcubacteria group bacterium RIFCSPHIGHO2_01_FULL_56_18]|nr:MAG: hypothetical protein A2854_03880 [Parcubacteria group bacterium RIFCSPHIGHO2_01_FULL_56_18]
MLMRKIVALREGIKKGSLNPLWVERMLQSTIADNHAGDFALRPVWITLVRPKLSEISELLEREETRYGHGIDPQARGLLGQMNWTEGPDTADLTIATIKNLFVLPGGDHTEGQIIENALEQGLQTCPDWIVPALALHAERTRKEDERHTHLNLCLTHDEKRGEGVGMFFRRDWRLYRRSVDRSTSWCDVYPINWLFVKPKVS